MAYRTVFILIFLASLILLTACAGNAAGAAEASPTLTPTEAQGRSLFSLHCATCHTTTPGVVIVGPPLAGVARTAGERLPGVDARTYLTAAILSPDDYVVEGFANLMPPDIAESLTPQELAALVDYLLTLD